MTAPPARQQIQRRARHRARRAHCLGRLAGAPAGEDRQPRQQPPLGIPEQVIGPVDRGAQRLVALDRPAAPAREQIQTPIERPGQLRHVHARNSRRSKLDRQRHPVETPTDLHYRTHVGVAEPKIRDRRPGPDPRTTPPRRCARRVETRVRGQVPVATAPATAVRRRWRAPPDSSPAPQLPHTRARAFPPNPRPLRGRVHSCRPPTAAAWSARTRRTRLHRQTRLRGDAEHRGEHVDDTVLIAHGRQLHQPRSLPKARQHLRRDLQRETRSFPPHPHR